VVIGNLNLAESQESKTIVRAALLPSVSLNTSENVERIKVTRLIGSGLSCAAGSFLDDATGPSFSAPLSDLTVWLGYGCGGAAMIPMPQRSRAPAQLFTVAHGSPETEFRQKINFNPSCRILAGQALFTSPFPRLFWFPLHG